MEKYKLRKKSKNRIISDVIQIVLLWPNFHPHPSQLGCFYGKPQSFKPLHRDTGMQEKILNFAKMVQSGAVF